MSQCLRNRPNLWVEQRRDGMGFMFLNIPSAPQVRWLDQSDKARYWAWFEEVSFALFQRLIDYHMGHSNTTDTLHDEVREHTMQCRCLHQWYFPRDHLHVRVYRQRAKRCPLICWMAMHNFGKKLQIVRWKKTLYQLRGIRYGQIVCYGCNRYPVRKIQQTENKRKSIFIAHAMIGEEGELVTRFQWSRRTLLMGSEMWIMVD